MPQIYLAGPFFNPTQVERIDNLCDAIAQQGFEVFSPKDECVFDPQHTTPREVLDINIDAMSKCKAIVAVTDDRDPGTMWECGWAYAMNIPVIYVWLSRKSGQKFNIVLAATGSVTTTITELRKALDDLNSDPVFVRRDYYDGSLDME